METMTSPVRKQGKALSEYESKLLIAACGIPITREGLARDAEEAVRLAESIGYPVALKGCSAELMHKSELGVVELNLRDEPSVRGAYRTICEKTQGKIDGVLIQEMVMGWRELILGLHRDPAFGPCVMIGLGGVMTEVFKDTVFRVAPVDMVEAREMVEELRCRPMLDRFRGQEPADVEAVCRAIVGLGRLGMERPDVLEVDVNPLIVDAKGRIAAADGLVILESAPIC